MPNSVAMYWILILGVLSVIFFLYQSHMTATIEKNGSNTKQFGLPLQYFEFNTKSNMWKVNVSNIYVSSSSKGIIHSS